VFEGEPDLCGIGEQELRTTGAVSAQKGHSKSLNSTKLTGAVAGRAWGASDVDLLRGPAATSSGARVVGRDAGEECLDDGAERCVALRADQAAAVDEERRRGRDAEAAASPGRARRWGGSGYRVRARTRLSRAE